MATIEQLKQKIEEWEGFEGIDDEEGEQDWLHEGISLYERLIEADKENESEYLQSLSMLCLNYGRNEKMKHSNFIRALRFLKQAAYIAPKDPRPCYHLSFLLEKESNYEGALFYAERAIKLGLEEKLVHKLICNMALCYFKIRLYSDAFKYLYIVEEKAKANPALAAFLLPYQARFKVSRKKGYVPLSEQYGTFIETEADLENSVNNGERVVLIVHPYQTQLNGLVESVRFSSVKAQILETIILSKAPVSIRQISEVLWGYDSENMSESYVPRMIKDIRTDIKTATGIDGKELLKTESGKYIWNHQLLRGSIHYRQMMNRRRGSDEGITIL